MESNALRKRAAWLHAVAMRLPAEDVAQILDHYAEEMLDKAERIERLASIRSEVRREHIYG